MQNKKVAIFGHSIFLSGVTIHLKTVTNCNICNIKQENQLMLVLKAEKISVLIVSINDLHKIVTLIESITIFYKQLKLIIILKTILSPLETKALLLLENKNIKIIKINDDFALKTILQTINT